MTDPPTTGLLILHGNRLEQLAALVFDWLESHPLPPLEPETFLVQSNGMAEWLKMELATAQGICAATRVELPARFVWRAYRAVLGRAAVPPVSALDKLPLTWRLMRLLPRLAARPGFEPVAAFLGAGDGQGDAARRLQLARRLADLFDQYQVYRSDWLNDWAGGHDRLRGAAAPACGEAGVVSPEQRWQPALWRELLDELSSDGQQATRASLQGRFLHALRPGPASGPAPAIAGLPRRVVLFGTTHIPQQTLEAVAALSAHCQVLMAVPNPCRYYWADIIDGREQLRAERRRHALRNGRDLSAVALQDMHAHGHPLLAAWGRQSRDFVRQLDAVDDAQAARRRFDIPRVDLFDETPAHTLLQQVQAAIRDLLPLAEHAKAGVPEDDRSIVFHVAHSAQREIEILHDQLLQLLADPPDGRPLNPRDIVVMVPDIDSFASAIRSVFGQHPRGHARHIPWGIADQRHRGCKPLLVALEWLLRVPQQRIGASEVRDLLDVPAVSRRLGIDEADLPTLVDWIGGAGVRWGLDLAHRASLGLAAGGTQNTWDFGLRRMLLGYATGELRDAQGYAGTEPYAEVAGLSAGLAGALAELLQVLTAWWRDAGIERAPAAWAERLRRLMAAVFEPTDDTERALLAALDDALAAWLQACEAAGFDSPLDLAVVREAWLDALDEPDVSRRFKAGGVTFCTLLPLRAIPFELVCLLGMNDGDFPRRGARNDFDLMALPGQARPGDRARRDDDRQLMLDALLSARRVLYVSWAGRSPRDNQLQPPSVLVSQLRDYLVAGWGEGALGPRTTEHPLQPFSRRYFEPRPEGTAASAGHERDAPRGPLFTYAGEWRAAHAQGPADEPWPLSPGAAAREAGEPAGLQLGVASLASFLRNPVQAFFRHRLQVAFDEHDGELDDDEAFASDGLDRWAVVDEVLGACRRRAQAEAAAGIPSAEQLVQFAEQEVARVKRAGRLPLGAPGRQVEAELVATLQPMLLRWHERMSDHACALDMQVLRIEDPQDGRLVFDDTLAGLRAAADGGMPLWIDLQAGKMASPARGGKELRLREDKLLVAWVRCLASAASACPARGLLIGPGAVVEVSPPKSDEAQATLIELMRACRDGLRGESPLPTAVRTALAYLRNRDKARQVYEGGFAKAELAEGREACLARLYPDFASLSAEPGFEPATRRLYASFQDWLASDVRTELLPGAEADADNDAETAGVADD